MAMSIMLSTVTTEIPPFLTWTRTEQMCTHNTAMMQHGPWPLHSIEPSLVRLSMYVVSNLACY